MFAATKHASLQNADAVLQHLAGVISGLYLPLGDFRAPRTRRVQLSLDVRDLYAAGEPIVLGARPSQPEVTLGAAVVDVETAREVARLPMTPGRDGWHRIELARADVPAGAYRVTVSGNQSGVEPAEDVFEVLS
jgi:hypothetical protein